MDDNDFADPCVLALLVPLKDRIGLISLTEKFRLSLAPVLEGHLPTENVVLQISRSSTGISSAPRSVGSLTVLYGENGWGKTQLMLDACRSLSDTKGERRVAIIWESRGHLYLDPGSLLKRSLTIDARDEKITIRRIENPFGAVFYTTSPFETKRRRVIKSESFFDVTPSFSPENPFEGGALLRAFAKLPTDFPFIEAAEVRMRVRLPSLRSQLEKIIPSLKRRDPDLRLFQAEHIRTLSRLDKLLHDRAQKALVVELLIALQRGENQAADVLLKLADQIQLINNTNDLLLVDQDTIDRTTEAVVHFLSDAAYPRAPQYNNSLDLYHYLDIELPSIVYGLGRWTTLGKLAQVFDNFKEHDWEKLQQATQLGLVSWSFRNLSSGQVALLMLFSSLSSAMSRMPQQKAAFLFIDEGEMFMHPAWQRRYITDLLEFLKKFPKVSSHLHVILSTHSLIVAADAPPNRLFDIRNGEMTNGFGYGPKDLLDQIYRVDEFQGEHAGSLMVSLVDYIRNPAGSRLRQADALALARSIADDRLRNYLTDELVRRGNDRGALA